MSSSCSNTIRRRAMKAAGATAASTTITNNNNKTMMMHISSPRIVASALDWHCKRRSGSGGYGEGGGGCILNLRITRHWLDLAICSHPALHQQQQEEESEIAMVQQLPSIPLVMNKNTRAAQVIDTAINNNSDVKQHRQRQHQQQPVKVLQHGVAQELASIVQRYNVCGTLVCWPVQPGGWLGSQCGRVLFTLDQIAQQQQQQQQQEDQNVDHEIRSSHSSYALGFAIPLCLWDDFHFHQARDSWGRDAVYAHSTGHHHHHHHQQQQQEQEQFSRDRSDAVATRVWKDFCRVHWPELYQFEQKKQQQKGTIVPLAVGGGGGGGGGDWNVKSPLPKTTALESQTVTTPGNNNPWLARRGEHRLC